VPAAPATAPPAELTSAEVAHLLAAPLDRVRTLQAGGVLRLTDNGRPLLAEILLALDADAGLRLDALTPFATPLYTFAVTPARVLLLDYLQREAIGAPATAAAAKRLLRFDVEPRLLMQAAAGGLRRDAPPWIASPPAGDDEKPFWCFQSGDWRVGVDPARRRPAFLAIGLTVDGGRSTVDSPIEPDSRQPSTVNRQPAMRIAWGDPETIGGAIVARRIEIDRPQRRQSLVLRLHDVRVNEPLDRASLMPIPPDGWRRRQLDRDGNDVD
jgi:hypothetical protein